MVKCKRHQWDYIRYLRKGKEKIMMNNPMYAMWICPYCNKEKYIKLEEGKKW